MTHIYDDRGVSMRIAVIGGGPGGLFVAALARGADPSREVTVFERNDAEDTFGFGVVFSDATLAGIHDADPVLRTALIEHGAHWDPIEVRLHGERLLCGGNGMAAVERRTLLHLLQQRGIEVGVDVRFATEADPGELLAAGYDLVIAADGTNSRLRERFATELDAALDALEAIGARRFLLESMAPPGVDLLAGASRDPVFGPVVLLGLGGVVAEALADVAVAPATVSATEAGALADELAGRALLDGFRGGPVVDRAAVGAVLVALGGLLLSRPEIQDVEINPLRVTPRA
jgi:hypothetical protein